MRYPLILVFFGLLIPYLSESQDSGFVLKGKLGQPSSFASFTLFYPRMQMDSMLIGADGSFLYSGNFSEAGEMQIGTKASSVKIWLDTGLTYLLLSEKPDRYGNPKLTVDSVIGSEDTYLYYHTLLPKFNTTNTKINRVFYSQKESEAFVDSLRKATKASQGRSQRVEKFEEIDSVFKKRPNSKLLPWLTMFYGPVLGIENMQTFYYSLTAAQQKSEGGTKLLKELNKLQLLKPGNLFEDFSMKDDSDKAFYFSSVKSKYILIDFWASWCGPCRANHPYLREVYLKNKDAGFEIISISLDDNKKQWLQAIQQDKITWVNVSDLQGRNNAIAVKYKITGIPFSVLLNEKREIIMMNPSSFQLADFFKSL